MKECYTCFIEKPPYEFSSNQAKRCKKCTEERKGWRVSHYKRQYGIDFNEYQRLLFSQDSKCKICKSPPDKQRLHVDHNHKTGKVRGLLCANCNFAIGYLKDDPKIAESIRNYLMTNDG